MVILDTDDIAPWRAHLAETGVRIAADLSHGAYAGLQLHPRDTGGALLEINTTRGNGPDPYEPYAPAGDHWQQAARTDAGTTIRGAVLQSDDPERLARRWATILRREPRRDADGWRLTLDHAALRFVMASDGRGEGLAGMALEPRARPPSSRPPPNAAAPPTAKAC